MNVGREYGAPWHVFQWEDGSQQEDDLYNVGSDKWETAIVTDIPRSQAALIAAAPELLVVCQKLLKVLERSLAQNWGHYGGVIGFDPDIHLGRRAIKAIQQATGEQQ